MKTNSLRFCALLLLATVMMSACNMEAPQRQQSTIDSNAIHTQAAETIDAQLTSQPIETVVPQPTHTSPLPTSTEEPSPGSPTPLPEIATATPQVSLTSFGNTDYGFAFDYMSEWSIDQEQNRVTLTRDNLSLSIGFRRVDENVQISIVSPVEGELEASGAVPFLGQDLTKEVLMVENKLQAVYYPQQNKEIPVYNSQRVAQLLFSISLMGSAESGADSIAVDISAEIIAEVDKILESFSSTFELPGACIDKAEYIEDVTVPDDTVISPGAKFEKTWRLRNAGTCTWTDQYELVFIDGDKMGETASSAVSTTTYPGKSVDLTIELTAPSTRDTYRGNWMLQNPEGNLFGIGPNADEPFWVQIIVEDTETVDDLDLGSPTWHDDFSDSSNWYLLDTENTKFVVKDGHLMMKFIKAGEPEEWGLSSKPAYTDFYIEAKFTTGNACSGLDRYGILVRAPSPNSGYVIGFSCDGRYRLYLWDGENFNSIQKWDYEPNIQTGSGKTNRVGIYAKGDVIKIYANGNLVAEFKDNTYDEGRLGLLIGSVNTDNLKVFVERVSFWELN